MTSPLVSFLKPYRLSATVALLLMLTEVGVELASPLILARLIDQGILPHDWHTVLAWGGVLIALAGISFAAGIANTFYAVDTAQGMSHDIRAALFGRLIGFDSTQYQRFAPSTLITRLTSDINQIQTAIFLLLRLYLRSPLLIIGSILLALRVDPVLALALVVVTPVTLVSLGWVMRRGFRLFREVQKCLDQINRVVGENLTGIRLIRSYVRGAHESARFGHANHALMQRATSASRLPEVSTPFLLLLMNLSVLFILWFGQRRVQLQLTEVGATLAVLNYAVRVTTAYTFIAMIITNLTAARAAWQRSVEVLQQPDSPAPASGVLAVPVRAPLIFDRVGFSYPGTGDAVLQELSFRTEPGQTVAIMGATGAGKSTLLRLVPRLYEPAAGRILLGEDALSAFDVDLLRAAIGYVPQEALLFSGTVRDNLAWGNPDADDRQIIAAARAAQIHDTILSLPQQYDTPVQQKGGNFSGGQKQRLSIARALLRQPSILLLDDCTSALDNRTEAHLLQAIRAQECTTLLITQKIDSARHADAVLLLQDGKLLAFGTHEQLLHTSELYRRIARSQQYAASHSGLMHAD